jgi:transcriptional regulator
MPDFTTGRKGLSDYRITRKIDIGSPSVTRLQKNAHEKLEEAKRNLEWAERISAKE